MKEDTQKSMMQLVATSIDINSEMEAFHRSRCRAITYTFRDTFDEDGMRAFVNGCLPFYVWPRRVFDKDRDIQPFMYIPAITICLN